MPSRHDRDRAAFYRALGDPLRVALLDRLARKDLTAGALADAVGARPSAVSNALARLQRDGLVERAREGRAVRVRLRHPELARFLRRSDAMVLLAAASRGRRR